MRHVDLPGGSSSMPVLGLGTWRMGDSRGLRAREIAAVRGAIELGYRLIDTAEMYGEGGAEEVVGAAIAEAVRANDVRREDLVVVSKVYPHNASRSGCVAACDRSRKRLGLDTLDLYLLHWRGQHPLRETVAGMQQLVDAGAIHRWGVSNLDVDDLRELERLAPDPATGCATDQVWYSPGKRGPEFDLLPWMRERGMPLMAYSPLDMGDAADDATLAAIGHARGLTAAQVALAWLVRQPGVVAIPKAMEADHQRENLAATEIVLSDEECARIDAAFPAPRRKVGLAMN